LNASDLLWRDAADVDIAADEFVAVSELSSRFTFSACLVVW
jgi:hypothetical protein